MPSPQESTDGADGRAMPRSVVVCGLGNPGDQYADTRHNIGFWVIDELARRRGVTLDDDACRSRSTRVDLEADDRTVAMTLVAPQTYMNRSGYALRCFAERRAFAPEDMLVVYDEVHLPFGRLRLRPKGSPAGHRGLESVLENLGSDRVPRLRIGVGGADGPPQGEDLVEFVLAPFTASEREEMDTLVARAADACECWATRGAEAAMQAFNGG